jgi:hypothetical protein
MRLPPKGFDACLLEIHRALVGVAGFLSKREVEFLALAAACPTAPGEILEIGSYRGRSAIALAKAAALSDWRRVAVVDPLPNVHPMIPGADGRLSALALLEANLTAAGVRDQVTIHQMYSHELAPSWNAPLRLLWIDGDHTYDGAKTDFDLYSPFLNEGAIVAFHDILNVCDCKRVFQEDVLDSPRFGACGFVGSIGWSQYLGASNRSTPYAAQKAKLSRRLAALARFEPQSTRSSRAKRMHYRFHRWFIPHQAVSPQRWLRQVA